MIRLFTGLPGHGKTLFVVGLLLKMRQEDASRPLYVRGIKDLTIDHAETDGASWESLPDGSIVVIDEAQQVFPIRRSGEVPSYVSALATHRHRGIDLLMITQHPSLIDSFVRKLIDRHTHLFRISGAEVSTVYEWNEVMDEPRAMAARDMSESHVWKYPKELFGMYSSAVLHTAKFKIPKKVMWLIGFLIGICLCAWYFISWARAPMDNVTAAVTAEDNLGAGQLVGTPAKNKRLTPEEWLELYTPRFAHRPESAPAYDKMMASTQPPKLACIDVLNVGCRCFTEQATPWDGVPKDVCKSMARVGSYHPR